LREGGIVLSERTVRLYDQHPPKPREDGSSPTLDELLHEVEVAAKYHVSRTELAQQLDLHPDLFASLVNDSGIDLG
jgi:hypothetical protein